MGVGRGWKLVGAAAGALLSAVAGVVAGLEPQDLLLASQWVGERLLAVALIGLLTTVCVGDLSFNIVRSGGKNTSFVLGFGGRWRPASPASAGDSARSEGPSDGATDEVGPATTALRQLSTVPDPGPDVSANVRRLPAQQTMREDDLYALRLLESGQPLPTYWSGYIMGRFVVDQIPQGRNDDREQLTLPLSL